jgi:Domain of unknown function DUF11
MSGARERFQVRVVKILSVAWLLAGSALAAGQDDVDILADSIECWPIDEFLVVHSAFVPPEDVHFAKFYFRSVAFPDFYFVDLALSAGEGSAVVPKAQPDTKEVTFYLEVVTSNFTAVRTVEKTVPVSSSSECKRRNPAALFFTGQNPNITVGATRPGAVPIPPGFQIDGISGPGAGGGVSGKTIGIIAGVGGGTAAALALAAGSSETTSTAVGGGSTSTMVAGPTSTAVGGGGSSTITTTASGSPPSTSSNTSTVAATTTASTTAASTSSATTSNPTTSVAATADMALTKTGSTSAATGKNFNYSVTVDNLGPSTATGVQVADGWTAGLASFVSSTPAICKSVSGNQVVCDLGSMSAKNPITIRFTLLATKAGTLVNTASVSLASPADPNSSNNSAKVTTRILPLSDGPPAERDVNYRSSIVVEPRDGSVRGQILVNGSSFQATDNSGDFSYTARVHDGANRVETRLVLPASTSGLWRFDFGATAELVPGSFRVESGQLLSQDGSSIVFAVGRGAPPPRFIFEIGAGRRSDPR